MFVESGSLAGELLEGRRDGVLTLSGQDPRWRAGLAELRAGRSELTAWCDAVIDEFAARLDRDPMLIPTVAMCTVEPRAWLEGAAADEAPPAWSTHPAICLPGTALAQLCAVRVLADSGLVPGRGLVATTGHSAGLGAAWVVARHGAEVPVDAAVDLIIALAMVGDESSAHPWSLASGWPADTLEPTRLAEDDGPVTMLSVAGLTEPALVEIIEGLATVTTDGIDAEHSAPTVSLQNAWDRLVVSGPAASLAALRDELAELPAVRTEALASLVPYHHPALGRVVESVLARLGTAGVTFDGELIVPVVDPRDGERLDAGTTHDVTPRLIESWCAHPVRWADTLVDLVGDLDEPVVIDAGPATLTARMTERAVRGTGAFMIALGDIADVRALTIASLKPLDALRYDRFAPRLRIDEQGQQRLHTRHTDWSGRSPVILAGMTPTTVDVPIVAAAANAGHLAELAGGGQVSPAIFRERIEELREQLGEGHEIVFNTLYLDPYLWNLHIGRQRLVQNARRAGAPICGVTVSAGIPDVEEAVELLDELAGLGVWLNAFKPGDDAGVDKVLAIADATDHRVWMHLEGGLAGGHHGWSDLDQLLVRSYHDIRSRPNVALAVGGGIGDPERAAALLDGSWARRHTGVDMPVDAVLIGTAAMAVAEATTSPGVKQALVDAPGTMEPVAVGERRGGVTSGRSSLGADIHYLDNHASRVAAMLDEVAGDAAKVAARHDEIVEALAGTAKPWFGDLSRMSYVAALERFVELCALGRHGRYDDGAWLDPTHRQLFADLLDRFDARCCDAEEGEVPATFADLGQLDDPAKAIAQFVQAHPSTSQATLEPSDAAFVIERCDSTPKPVPFVVAIDAEVRRRYLADSLWYAHDDRWSAEEVLVIPGPAAVMGITRADEPVAELLDRFGSTALERAAKAGAETVAPPSATETLIGLSTLTMHDAAVPSPIRAMAAGAEWDIESDDDTAEVVATIAHGRERLELRGPTAPTGTVRVAISWPAITDLDGDGRCEFDVIITESAGVRTASVEPTSFARSQSALLDMLVRGARRRPDTSGPALLGGVAVPDATMTTAWPTLFELLARHGAGDDLTRLVHARHTIRRSEGDNGTAVATPAASTQTVEAGLEISTVVEVEDLHCSDTFLVRGVSGPATDTGPTDTGPAGTGPTDTGPDTEEADTEAAGADGRVATPRSHLGRAELRAPRSSTSFAVLSGDANPLHRSDLMARLAGFGGRIVHGLWTSTAAQRAVIDTLAEGDDSRLRSWDLRFLDVVLPGDELIVDLTRVGMRSGHRIVEIDITGPAGLVATGEIEIAPVRTAYVFPGQGIQQQGMGRTTRERSAAARDVWARAERYCRDELGFSLIEVVDDNPTSIVVGPVHDRVEHRHPAGVLHLTQFTQVAMATLAASQVAELREAGVFDESAVLAGHSVGEYNALAAIGGVLPLEVVLGVVWARGSAMHDLVPRDESGASDYRLAVVRPHLAGLDADAATSLVDQVANDTGELCEVVNHNLRGRQYAVAGTTTALAELQRRLGEGDTPGRAPYLEVPGIDVPFHSRALADGVAAFRAHLDAVLPTEVDPDQLLGRYVPNLHPVPFSIDRDYVMDVAALCDGATRDALAATYEELADQPRRLARELLVELLAWQFASPVRWIETTDVMLAEAIDNTGGAGAGGNGLGVRRVVEVGVGAAPTLSNLTKAATAAIGHPAQVLHVEIDDAEIFESDENPAPTRETASRAEGTAAAGSDQLTQATEGDWDGDAPGPATPAQSAATPASPAHDSGVAATGASPSVATQPAASQPVASQPVASQPAAAGSSTVEDVPVSLEDSVRALLAFSASLRPDQLGDDSIDELVDGASSRRNQVLMDLGKEMGLGSVDGAHEASFGDLVSTLRGLVAGHRHPGPVLGAMIDSGVAAAAAQVGSSPGKLLESVGSAWGLGEGWVQQCRLEIALGTREGQSRRGGPLQTLEATTAEDLVEQALHAAAARLGVTVSKPVAASDGGDSLGGAAVDSIVHGVAGAIMEANGAALAALSAATGIDLAATSAGIPVGNADSTNNGDATDTANASRLRELDAEHGSDRADSVRSVFRPGAVITYASAVPWARADLDRLVHDTPPDADELRTLVARLARVSGHDDRFDASVEWYLRQAATGEYAREEAGAELASLLERVRRGRDETDRPLDVAGRTVLVTGASPGSIAEQVAATLLRSGATVVALTSSLSPSRRRAWRRLERDNAAPGSRLVVAPANLASFRDIDAVLDWLADGEDSPGLPDVVVPFAAPGVLGDAADAGPRQEIELRVMLLGVERLVATCAELVGRRHQRILTAVLPMSPNQGMFGGDGAYGHAKAGLEVLATRRAAETARWGRWCRTVGVTIGWVRGTGLMGAHDTIASLIEDELGVRTFDAAEMGEHIAGLCVAGVDAVAEDVRVSITGGLETVDAASFARVVRRAGQQGPDEQQVEHDTAERSASELNGTGLSGTGSSGSGSSGPGSNGSTSNGRRTIRALPTPRVPRRLAAGIRRPADVPLEDMVVLCGVAEIGPWGSSATRADAERNPELSPRAVLELAAAAGLIEWSSNGRGGRWLDVASGDSVDEADIAEQYRDEVLQRCGIRATPNSIDVRTQVFTERPITVAVGSRTDAESLAAATPGAAVSDAEGTWRVTMPAGTSLFAQREDPLPRGVSAPIPDGLDPTAFGVPDELASGVDPAAAWSMATAAEAFRDAGTEPEELLAHIDDSRVACTHGTGMGGMDSIRTLHLAPRHGTAHANDVLQEALGNVPAAHVVQSFVGGTGPMIHPVAACATAGVSLELALDLIRVGKADVVVGGGYDDIGPEGIIGFAEMAATADDAAMADDGFLPAEMSRPGDRRRAGFIESQGGGSFLACRASLAAELGLNVRAVVVFAHSYGDGLQTSIPAPGDGALACVRGGQDSPLARALQRHGLDADDIAVVSKHDTSTLANDPNEADIHETIQRELGRSPGNPLRVVSQKSITGHAKGGSALWQMAGLCDVFDDGIVPGNPNLDSVDPDVQPGPWLVVDDRPLQRRHAPRAALLTSLGFGHVSVVAALAHPEVFETALRDQRGDDALESHTRRAEERRADTLRRRRAAVHGDQLAYRRRSGR